MSNPVENRQKLSEFVDDRCNWAGVAHVNKLDGVEHNESDPLSYYVREANGEKKKLAYDSHNALTQFIHDPDDTWYQLVQTFGPTISNVLEDTQHTVKDFRELWYDATIVDEQKLIVEKRGASILSEILTKLDNRGITSTIPRYYIALHQVTVWKNKDDFPIESLMIGGTRKYYSRGGPVKLLPPKRDEPDANSVDVSTDDMESPFD